MHPDWQNASIDTNVARTYTVPEVQKDVLAIPQTVAKIVATSTGAGAYLWDVRVDGHLERWLMDYSCGTFPFHQGEVLVYRGQHYLLQQVWSSMLDVTRFTPESFHETDNLVVAAV
jgi:hypothetical protein